MDMKNFIHPTAIITENVILGNNNYIGPYCIIGYPAEHKKYWDSPLGKVIIGNNNVFTGLVTIDAGTESDTVIGNNCWFLKHSYVGHDCLIENDVTISTGAKIGGHVIVGKKSNIGMNATVHQWKTLPEGIMLGMNSTITKTTILEPYTKYAGTPARKIGENLYAKNNDRDTML